MLTIRIRLGREITYKEELDALQKENEMSIKELKAHYSLADNSTDNSEEETKPEEETTSNNDEKSSKYEFTDSDPFIILMVLICLWLFLVFVGRFIDSGQEEA